MVPDVLDPGDRQPGLVGQLGCKPLQVRELVPRRIRQPERDIDLPLVAPGCFIVENEVVALIPVQFFSRVVPCLVAVLRRWRVTSAVPSGHRSGWNGLLCHYVRSRDTHSNSSPAPL